MNTLLDLNSETNKYKIKIENFEGPLDLLCHLIEKNKMNIYDISISEITDQYVAYINSMQEMSLEVTGDFLIMASNLLYMKSKIFDNRDIELSFAFKNCNLIAFFEENYVSEED